ncbi:MAG TPA: HEAT repeat domain-containing protein [Polyangiaceae bacterium]|nr:HEAT repeat domain-containing protein [Polyangiaceae bacterium]
MGWAAVLAAGLAGYALVSRPHGEAPSGVAAPAPVGSTSQLDFEPTAAQRLRLVELRESLSEAAPRFTGEVARERANAKLFTYLAATSDEPLVIEASLQAIGAAYSSRSSRKAAPDADLDRTLSRHLRSDRPSVARAAFRAARIPLMAEHPGSELVEELVETCAPGEPVARRYAALRALDLLRPDRRGADVVQCFVAALQAEQPHLVSAALFALAQSNPSLEPARAKGGDLAPLALRSLAHPDPGVRGRALELLAELPWLVEADVAYASGVQALKDPHPYGRAVAAATLARLGDPRAVHHLIEQVDDLAVAEHEITGFPTIDAGPGRLQHAVPGRKRVAAAALFAIQSLSSSPAAHAAAAAPTVPPAPLKLGGRTRTLEELRENAVMARSWYQQVRHRLPAP